MSDMTNTEKDPAEWTTGDEPMTGAQASYLKTLSEEAHVEFDASLTKAEASRRIDELQAKTGHGGTRENEIVAWCREHLAGFKVPKTVVFGELPKTSTGKIQKYVLRDRARAL